MDVFYTVWDRAKISSISSWHWKYVFQFRWRFWCFHQIRSVSTKTRHLTKQSVSAARHWNRYIGFYSTRRKRSLFRVERDPFFWLFQIGVQKRQEWSKMTKPDGFWCFVRFHHIMMITDGRPFTVGLKSSPFQLFFSKGTILSFRPFSSVSDKSSDSVSFWHPDSRDLFSSTRLWKHVEFSQILVKSALPAILVCALWLVC